jgi:hypothetical protein
VEAYGSGTYGFDRYPRELATLLAHGDAIGAHVHPYRWVERTGAWLQDFGDPGWVAHCIHSSLSAVTRAVGGPCRVFRFGDRWHSTEAMNRLRESGVRIDLTLEPGLAGGRPLVLPGEAVSGTFDGFEHVPRAPYTPSVADFRVPGAASSLCALPLTSTPPPITGLLDRCRRCVRPRWWRPPWVMPLSLWQRWRPAGTFTRLIDMALAAQRRPYLAFAIRTDTGVRPEIFTAVDEALGELLAHPQRARFRFCTPEEALSLLGWRAPQSGSMREGRTVRIGRKDPVRGAGPYPVASR